MFFGHNSLTKKIEGILKCLYIIIRFFILPIIDIHIDLKTLFISFVPFLGPAPSKVPLNKHSVQL